MANRREPKGLRIRVEVYTQGAGDGLSRPYSKSGGVIRSISNRYIICTLIIINAKLQKNPTTPNFSPKKTFHFAFFPSFYPLLPLCKVPFGIIAAKPRTKFFIHYFSFFTYLS